MKVTNIDILLSILSSLACLSFSLVVARFAHELLYLPHGFQAFYLIFVFMVAFIAITLLLLYGLRLFCPLREGNYILKSDTHSLVWKLLGYFYVAHLWPLINANLVPVNVRAVAYRLLGAKIGRGVMIGGKVLEPSLVEIGDYSMLGEDSILTAHTVVGNKVDLGKIVVGRDVTIGGTAVILPDVHIGDSAIVAPGAVVKKGTRIGPGEIWGGVPARKIGVIGERGREGGMERQRDGEMERGGER
ncbi:hypothetical protein [Desulfonatronum thioautotrophicum]|uniref:hypothetical protein n=1 Tax=Desulfonatronum thioautotrophicum TaxID=617001 RepID=UPI00069ADC2F|nr:hypothetical protein [Desulfonatronum thioautotrophicum]